MSRLREISERLSAITRELEEGEVDDQRAGELTREAAQLTADAVEEASRLSREAEPG